MARTLSDQARGKMLDAARRIVVQSGVEQFTIDAVAKMSGVAKTTIYRHFPNPDQLLIESTAELAPDIPDIDTGSLRGDLCSMAKVFAELAAQPKMRQLISAVLHKAAKDPKFARLHREFMACHKAPVTNALQRAVARGEVDPDIDPQLAHLMMEGPFLSRVLIEGEPLTSKEIDSLVTMIVNALTRKERPALH